MWSLEAEAMRRRDGRRAPREWSHWRRPRQQVASEWARASSALVAAAVAVG